MIVYITTSPPKIIIKYPTPFNAETTIYKDKADNCYKYESKKAECPTDESKIKDTPLIH